MEKIKISGSIMALLMLVTLFTEWKYMIIVAASIWLLCNNNERLKNLAVKVVSIAAACSLISMIWDLISGWIGVGVSSLNEIPLIFAKMGIIINFGWLISFASIITGVLAILTTVVGLLILTAKIKFIISIIANKPLTGLFKKIEEFLDQFTNFVTNSSYTDSTAQPVQTAPINPVPASTV